MVCITNWHYLQGCFMLCAWLSLWCLVPWINHLPLHLTDLSRVLLLTWYGGVILVSVCLLRILINCPPMVGLPQAHREPSLGHKNRRARQGLKHRTYIYIWYTSLWNLELIDIFADQIANTCMAIHIQSYRQHYQCHLGALVSINRCSATDIILPFAQKSRRNTRVSTLFTLFWPFSIWWETKSSSGDNFYNMTRLSNKRMFDAVLWAKKQTRFLFEIAYH